MSARDFDVEKFIAEYQHIAEYLEIAKQKYDEGNSTIILKAMHECLLLDRPIPEWLRVAFIEAYQSATAFEIRSWDEAFGPPHEKGAHLKTRKQHAELRFPIILRVAELAASGIGVDEGLFEKIAEELDIKDIGASTVRDIYYDDRTKELYESIKPLLPWLISKNSTSDKK